MDRFIVFNLRHESCKCYVGVVNSNPRLQSSCSHLANEFQANFGGFDYYRSIEFYCRILISEDYENVVWVSKASVCLGGRGASALDAVSQFTHPSRHFGRYPQTLD